MSELLREQVARTRPSAVKRGVNTHKAPAFMRAGEIIAESHEELPCVVDGLMLLGGTAILAARPKGGKSTLAMNLALAVARGESFLGRDVRQGSVLYLALEGARSGWRQLLRRLGATDADDVYLCIDRAPDGALQWLRSAIEEHSPVLVIIDTMQRLLRVKDGNDYAMGSNATDAVIELARECGAALLLLHHSGKTRHADIVDSVMGSTAWAASVDTVMVLRKSEHYRTIASEQRFGESLEEVVLEMDEQTHCVSMAGSKSDADRAVAVDAIIVYLRGRAAQYPEDVGVDEPTIDNHVEGRTKTKREALREGVGNGKIERTGTGKKGDPFLYSVSCSLVPDYTRERENNISKIRENVRKMGDFSCSGSFSAAVADGNKRRSAKQAALFEAEVEI